ncbi:MAG TPA: alkaline phosphatase family protein [Acidimicrobiales bacterium]
MTITRRRFLRGAGAAAGLAAAGGLRPARAAGGVATGVARPDARPLLSVPAAHSPIDTVVVVMMENRSFDHYLGWLSADEHYLEAGRRRYGPSFGVDAANAFTYRQPDGRPSHTHHLTGYEPVQDPTRGCGHPDPGHGWDEGRIQRDHGFVAKGSGNDEFALGFFGAADLPTYAPLVRAFTTFDHYHAAIMSSTYPNRLYLQSAQSGGLKDPPLPIDQLGFHWESIWDRLVAAGVSCANYATDVPQSLFFGVKQLPLVRPIEAFFSDAAAGTLPRVSFVDPGFTSGLRTDDHPVGDHRIAQAFVANLFNAFHAGPHWRRGAMIVTYDEWGGFFDHVRPPSVADDHASATDENNFGQVGFRVPTLLLSPFARPGYVDHRYYDHTSILRFIEWRWLGAPPEGPGGTRWWLTARDRSAHNIGASLVTVPESDARLDVAALVPVASAPCYGRFFQDSPGLDQVEQALIPPPRGNSVDSHPFDGPAAQAYLERLGYRVRPSLTLAELTSR